MNNDHRLIQSARNSSAYQAELLRGVVRSLLTAFHVEHSRGQPMGVGRIEDCQHMTCKAALPLARCDRLQEMLENAFIRERQAQDSINEKVRESDRLRRDGANRGVG